MFNRLSIDQMAIETLNNYLLLSYILDLLNLYFDTHYRFDPHYNVIEFSPAGTISHTQYNMALPMPILSFDNVTPFELIG